MIDRSHVRRAEYTPRANRPSPLADALAQFVMKSFRALFEKQSYVIVFYLLGGTILGGVGAMLQTLGVSPNGIVAILLTLVIPTHLAVFTVFDKFHRQKSSQAMTHSASDLSNDKSSTDLDSVGWISVGSIIRGAVACFVALLLCSVFFYGLREHYPVSVIRGNRAAPETSLPKSIQGSSEIAGSPGPSTVLEQTTAAMQAPRLKSVAQNSIEERFVVTEGNLRSLTGTIRDSLNKASEGAVITYLVTLADQSYYQTSKFDDILQDDDLPSRKITSLTIIGRGPVPALDKQMMSSDLRLEIERLLNSTVGDIGPSIRVVMGPRDIRYEVRSSDRDWVFNTQSDIVDRLKATTYRSLPIWTLGTILSFLYGLGGFVLIANILRRNYERQNPIDSQMQKIYLWQYIWKLHDKSITGNPGVLLALASITLVLMGGYAFTVPLLRYLYPHAFFVLGTQRDAYEAVQHYRSLVWDTILISSLIAFVTTAMANAVSRRREHPNIRRIAER